MKKVLLLFLLFSFFNINAQDNVIFILVDDLGYGDLGSFYQDQKSGNKFDTPYLDVMASEGMVIKDHYTVPVCAPSRSSLLQGLNPGHSHVRNNQFDKALPFDLNMPKVFQMAGYKTFMVGKHGLAGSKNSNFPAHPLSNGFDDFFGFLDHLAGHEHYPRNGTTDKNSFLYEGYNKITSGTNKTYTTDLFTARAKKDVIDHVQNNPNQPFFLYLAYDVPHSKLQIPTMAYPAGKGVNGGVQWTGASNSSTPYVNTAQGTIDSWHYPDIAYKSWPENEKKHATMIRRLDEGIGDLLQTLEDLGIDEETLVVFTSDNGPHAEGGQSPDFFESYGEYRGIKRDVTDGGIRVPVIARWPQTIPAGTSSTQPCGIWNWASTFAEVANEPIPARMDGKSLLPLLQGETVENDLPPYVEYYYPTSNRQQAQAIRIGDFMGIRREISSHSDDFEIYNILNDKKQYNNIASNYPDIQQQMKDQVLRLRIPNSTAQRPYDSALIPSYYLDGYNGLKYDYIGGDFNYLPRVEDISGATEGDVSNFDLSIRQSDSNFAITYDGFISVPTDGTYTFYLQSDAPSHLMIHDIHVVGGDLNHTTTEVNQSLQLKAGYHPIKVYYKHDTQLTFNLNLKYEGPGISKQTIPNSALFNGQIVSSPPLETTEIEIFHKSSGRMLYATSTGVVSNVSTTQSGDLTRWLQEDIGNGYFYLIHKESNRKLYSTGTNISTTNISATDNNVQWKWIDISGDDWYHLEHRGSGKRLHVKPDGTTEFNLIQTIWTGDNTRWKPQNVPPDTGCNQTIVSKYQIDGIWSSGASQITVIEGSDLVITGSPDNGTYSVLDPNGTIHSNSCTLNNISLSAAGVYTISNTDDCSTTFTVNVQNAPSCSDGIKNGDETGVDCGGSCAPCPCTSDIDGDGVCDNDDLDDDNDGILDDVECVPVIFIQNFSNGNGGGSHQFTQSGTEEIVIDFDYIDNSVEVKINGTSIDEIFQLERYWFDSNNEVFIKFNGGDYSSPWLTNSNGLPRLRITIDNSGEITLTGTRNTSSNSLEPVIRESSSNMTNVSFGTNTTVQILNPDISGQDGMSGKVTMNAVCDTDGDGILDYQDLDADNDGCLDALEGGNTIDHSQLIPSTLSVGNGSTTTSKNLGNVVDTNGVPTIVAGGQAVGTSLDASAQQDDCLVPDNEMPSMVVNLSASNITYNSFQLNWSASNDNVGVQSYKIYKDNVLYQTLSGLSTTLIDLNPTTTYALNVTAVDAAGNESQLSETLSVITLEEPTCTTVKVVIKTDYYGYETSWTLKNSSNEVVMQGSGYSNNTTYTVEECLTQDCYTFTIEDSYGDGICCSYGYGSYKVYSDDNLIVQGGNFGYSESKEVCNTTQAITYNNSVVVRSLVQSNKLENVVLYPNPAQSEIHIKAKKGTTYSIYNAYKQLLLTGMVTESPVNIQKLPAGFYIVKVVSEDGISKSLNFSKK